MVKIEADNQPAQPNDESQKSAQQPPKPSNPLKPPSQTPGTRSDGNGLSPYPRGPMTKFNWLWARDFVIALQTDYMMEVLKRPNMPASSQINAWMERYPKFKEWVNRARAMFADYLAERSASMFDDPPPMEKMATKNGVFERISMSGVQRERYKSQAMFNLAAKFNPDRYGEKLSVHNTNDWTQVLNVSLSKKGMKRVKQAMNQPIDVQPQT